MVSDAQRESGFNITGSGKHWKSVRLSDTLEVYNSMEQSPF
jgi:hypothetical protein